MRGIMIEAPWLRMRVSVCVHIYLLRLVDPAAFLGFIC